MGAVQFCTFFLSQNRTQHHTMRCGMVYYQLQCGAVTSFCGQYWSIWMQSCGLSNLVNSPTLTISHETTDFFIKRKIIWVPHTKNRHPFI